MSKKRLLDLRLVIGTEEGPTSAIWRVWSSRSDVYVVWGHLGHTEKLSFHSERHGMRVCRKAFTSERGAPPGLKNRCTIEWERWDAPAAGSGQGTCVLEACFPTDFLSVVKGTTGKAITYVKPAPSGMATVIEMFFTREYKENLVSVMGAERVVSCTQLPSGEFFVISRRDADFPGEQFFIPASPHEGLDILFTKDDPEGSGRPIRFAAFSTPRDGNRMSIWEYGGYKGKVSKEMIENGLGTFTRQTILDRSQENQ